jgi:hypothetical protein
MSRAEIELVDPDPGRARDFIQQARRFIADAERGTTSPESAVVLYWNACISSMDAVLTASGRRVGSGEDSHIVRVEAACGVLGAGYQELFERLDQWRRTRHYVSYAAITPPTAEVAALQGDARDVLDAAARFVTSATE